MRERPSAKAGAAARTSWSTTTVRCNDGEAFREAAKHWMEAFGLRSCSNLGRVLPDVRKRASEPFAALSGTEKEGPGGLGGGAGRLGAGRAGRLGGPHWVKTPVFVWCLRS